jgi:hypothetical protein
MDAQMIKIDPDNKATSAAINRCKAQHPTVKCAGANQYRVSGSAGNWYTVAVSIPRPGLYLAACECRGGRRNVCYHMIASLTVARAVKRAGLEIKAQAVKARFAEQRERDTAILVKAGGNVLKIGGWDL